MSEYVFKTHILCDDILTMIFNELNVRQLLRLERVSQQFMDCVGNALQRKNGLSIGNIPEDIKCMDKSHSLINGHLASDGSADHILNAYIDQLFINCPNVTTLYLKKLWTQNWWKGINISIIARRCPRLRCLSLKTLEYTPQLAVPIAEELSKLAISHLTIGGIDVGDDNHYTIHFQHLFTSGLPSLQRLLLYEYNRSLNELFHCLPQTLQSLDLLECQTLTAAAMDIIYTRLKHTLKDLSIRTTQLVTPVDNNAIFSGICDNLSLRRLSYERRSLSFNTINRIVSQHQLQRLCLKTGDNICLNTIGWRAMTGLISLSFNSVNLDLGQSQAVDLTKIFPDSLRRLRYTLMTYQCGCLPSCFMFCQTCSDKFINAMTECSRLSPRHILYRFHAYKTYYKFAMDLKCFQAYNKFRCFTLCFARNPYPRIAKLVDSITEGLIRTRCMTNRFCIELCANHYEALLAYLAEHSVDIPSNYKITYI